MDTPELVGVAAVCGGTAIIILIIWIAICYSLYKDDRDFCKLKKKLRQRREQYRRYRQRLQIQQLQRRQRTRASARPSRSIPTSPTNEPVEQDAVTPPPVQRNEPPPANTKRPPLSQLFPPSPHPPPSPPSTLPIPDLLETSNDAQQLPSPTRSEATRETCSETERDPNTETHTALGGDNVKSESNETSNGVGGKRVHFSECSTGGEGMKNNQSTAVPHEEDNGRSDLQYQPHDPDENQPTSEHPGTRQSGANVGRHYSPKFLREDEEVDVTLDESSSLPRYSWLFSDTGDHRSSHGINVWRRSLIGRRGGGRAEGSGRRDGGRADMAAFGQISTWPQFTI